MTSLAEILGIRLPEWLDRAVCAQTDPEAFYPDKGASTREAKAVCRQCPVLAECLEEALANDERYGIWGGTSERERRKISDKRGLPAPPEPDEIEDGVCAYPGCDNPTKDKGNGTRSETCGHSHGAKLRHLRRQQKAKGGE